MDAKKLSSHHEVGINVNAGSRTMRSEQCVLRFADRETFFHLCHSVGLLRKYLFEANSISEFSKDAQSLERLFFSPRENSTAAVRIHMSHYAESIVSGYSCNHNLNSAFVGMVKKSNKIKDGNPETYPEYYIPVDEGVLRVRGKVKTNLIPIAFYCDHVIIYFDDKGFARSISRPTSGNAWFKMEGELFRQGFLEGMHLDWYKSNYLKTVTVDDVTWKFTKGETVVLPDRVAGEEIERSIGQLIVAKNVDTKEKRVVPTISGLVKVMYQAILSIKEGGGEYPQELLSDVKNIQHVEAKRILMNIIGLEKFLTNAETLDMDVDSRIHRALVLDKDDNQKYLVCHDGSTEKQYVLPVPDRTIDRTDVATCAEAAAALSALSLPTMLPWKARRKIARIANSDDFVAES